MATDKSSLTPARAKAEAETARHKAAKAKAEAVKAKAEAAKAKVAQGHVGGFTNFIREQGVVGLAVGLAIGTAAGDTVRKLVEGFISPIVQFIVGSQEALNSAVWEFQAFGRQADFAWGAFVSSLITLIATALVIYFIIHLLKLDKLDKKKP
ncbi:hypothetical protein FJZ39_02360 [Candidatus Saccharibacteria bacterium]|nr:hypothetical protein [Candidatus Saccharibacteria bacterium]